MPDVLVLSYLYLLIITMLLLLVLWIVYWVKNPQIRRSPMRAKNLLRDLLFLITGLLGWYVFSERLLTNWIIMAGLSVLLILCAYATEIVGNLLWKRLEDHD